MHQIAILYNHLFAAQLFQRFEIFSSVRENPEGHYTVGESEFQLLGTGGGNHHAGNDVDFPGFELLTNSSPGLEL